MAQSPGAPEPGYAEERRGANPKFPVRKGWMGLGRRGQVTFLVPQRLPSLEVGAHASARPVLTVDSEMPLVLSSFGGSL